MKKIIRLLKAEDLSFYEKMETGVQEDYMLRAFHRLITRNHRLYGLFVEDELAVVGGFSIYAKNYAMLGRLRSDKRHRGKGFAAELMQHVLKEAFKLENILWAGAITEEQNKPAQRVINKLGLHYYTTLYAATTVDVNVLSGAAEVWTPITSLERKKEWLEKTYLCTGEVFPYECYYPFPASKNLFQEKDLLKWDFYETHDRTRFLIAKHDVKQTHYCHIIYPWSDFSKQKGFWETVRYAHKKLSAKTEEDISIWMDLTKEEAAILPTQHPFQLPSPWMLFGIEKRERDKMRLDPNHWSE